MPAVSHATLAGVMFSALCYLHWEWPNVENPYVSLLTVQQVAHQLNVTVILFDAEV